MRTSVVLWAMIISIVACQSPGSTDSSALPMTGYPEIDQITEAIMKSPEDPVLYQQRARAYADREAYDQAILDLNRSLALDSLNIDSYHLLADVYLDYYNSRMAMNTLYKAASLYPSRIPTLLKLTEFQFILKMYDPARETISRILSLDPQNAEAMFWSGMIYRDEDQIPQAIQSFQQATELDPDLIDAWIECGKLLSQEKKPIARHFFETAVRIDPESDHARHALAEYFQNEGQFRYALEVYRDLLLQNPQYADAPFNSGLIYLEMDSIEQAREQFDLALKVDPTRSLAYLARGNTLELLGKPEQARQDYEQALSLDPSMSKARQALDNLNKSIQ